MLVPCVLMAAAICAGADEFAFSMTNFATPTGALPLEWYAPNADDARPLVVILHGSGGLPGPDSLDWMHLLARRLAAEGYVALVPHYREAITSSRAAKNARRNAPDFTTCEKNLRDVLNHAAEQPRIDANRIGVIGYSMGAGLALRLGLEDRRVQSLALYSGGHPSLAGSRAEEMPPTLMLLGDADPSIRADDARSLVSLLRENKIPAQVQVYPRMGHGWQNHRADDAADRVSAFFGKYLVRPMPRVRPEARTGDATKGITKQDGRRMNESPSEVGARGTAPQIVLGGDLQAWLDAQGDEARELVVLPRSAAAERAESDARNGQIASVPQVNLVERDRNMRELLETLTTLVDAPPTVLKSTSAILVRANRKQLREILKQPGIRTVRPYQRAS